MRQGKGVSGLAHSFFNINFFCPIPKTEKTRVHARCASSLLLGSTRIFNFHRATFLGAKTSFSPSVCLSVSFSLFTYIYISSSLCLFLSLSFPMYIYLLALSIFSFHNFWPSNDYVAPKKPLSVKYYIFGSSISL